MIRIALIGAGAAVQQLHLPAIARSGVAQSTWIVDTNIAQAERVAQRFRIPHVAGEFNEVRGDVDAAIIATPHYLHSKMTEHFLSAGVHVLCEKPLCLTAADAERLTQLANEHRRVLAVGVFRRFYTVSTFVREAIRCEWLGSVQQVDVEEGSVYGWDLQSTFMMDKKKSGGGVLMDTGSHAVDRVIWWFDCPETGLDKYLDNGISGVESDCEFFFHMVWHGRRIPVRIELSRTRNLRNTYRVVMSNGTLEIPVNIADHFWLHDERRKVDDRLRYLKIDLVEQTSLGAITYESAFDYQIDEFCTAIETGKKPLNNAASVLPTVRLIEQAYKQKMPLEEPWMTFQYKTRLLGESELS